MSFSAVDDQHFTFRTATADDAPQISSLISKTWSEFNAHTVTPSDLASYLSGPLSPSSILSDIQSPSTHFIIITPYPFPLRSNQDTSPSITAIAQLTLSPSPPGCINHPNPIELQRLYLSSAHHGGGLGGKLIVAAEEYAKKEGYESVWLGVYEGNARGIRFYEKVGFERVGEKEFYAGDSLRRDWIMVKRI